jgi:uncharacterized protein YqeY
MTSPLQASSPATTWRSRLRGELVAARRAGDHIRISPLRSALAAIDNAEVPDEVPAAPTSAQGPFAASVAGLGAAEVARRELSEPQIRDLLSREVGERLAAARQYEDSGHDGRAAVLRAEAGVLTALAGPVTDP